MIFKKTFALVICLFSLEAFSNETAHEVRLKGELNPEKSMELLKNGNNRYATSHPRHNGADLKDRGKLVSGQKPYAIILSCSDSRVPPEIVFDQKLGEIFVVRTAGQSLDYAAIASIEYGVSHLGSNLIVIMGHESCGAVKAALATLKGGDAGSPWLNKLVTDLHPHLKRFSELSQTDGVVVESWANVEGVAHDLLERSEVIRNLVQSGDVKIQNALYHLESGQVEWR
ncbi:MAG: carbonic anhydrase [Bacteriovorax sp.]|nr:carbonic anhydrase [Bacteriovorax sp.]